MILLGLQSQFIVGGLISSNKADKIATDENAFRFLEAEYLDPPSQDGTCIYTDRIKAGIGIDTNAVKWNKAKEDTGMKPDRKNFSVKRELEDSDGKDHLHLKKLL